MLTQCSWWAFLTQCARCRRSQQWSPFMFKVQTLRTSEITELTASGVSGLEVDVLPEIDMFCRCTVVRVRRSLDSNEYLSS